MKTTQSDLSQYLMQFSQNYLDTFEKTHGHLPIVENDEQWQSPCIESKYDDDHMHWQAKVINDDLSYQNVEEALSLAIHQDIQDYFCTIYSEGIPATSTDGGLTLLFAWCEKDFQRLQENIIGHILMKQRLKQPITIFFAVTDDEDTILTVNNDNGEVWVERVGCLPHKKVADSLLAFLQSITANVDLV